MRVIAPTNKLFTSWQSNPYISVTTLGLDMNDRWAIETKYIEIITLFSQNSSQRNDRFSPCTCANYAQAIQINQQLYILMTRRGIKVVYLGFACNIKRGSILTITNQSCQHTGCEVLSRRNYLSENCFCIISSSAPDETIVKIIQ